MHFNLVDLNLMVRIAETNSLTKGAEAVHISVPAASARIKNMEESIGTKLLYRTSHGVTLTPSGQAVVHHARGVMDHVNSLCSDLREYASGVKGHLRLLANTTALSEFLPDVLRHYLRGHPDVNIDLREQLSPDIVRAVSDGKADIGIIAGNVRTENLEVLAYRVDHLVLVVPQGHALADLGPVSFAQTLAYSHVSLTDSSALSGFLKRICDESRAELRSRIQVGNFESACRMVAAEVGIAILPETAARRHAANCDIAVVPLADTWAVRAMQVCVQSLDRLPSYARDLVQLLQQDANVAFAVS